MTRPRVFSEQCDTCIFRSGNPMRLRTGRLADLVRENLTRGTALICHKTTYGQQPQEVVCRGWYDAYRDHHGQQAIQVVERLGGFEEVAPPAG